MKRLAFVLLLCMLSVGEANFQQESMLGEPLDYANPLTKGIVGFWPMNEGCGTRVTDLSGNARHGTCVADAHFVAGLHGLCLSFDGTGDYVSVPAFAIGTNVATLVLSINLGAIGGDAIVFETSANYNFADEAIICYFNGPDNRLHAGIQSSVGSARYRLEYISLTEQTGWHHVVIIFDNSTATGDIVFYVDGVLATASILISNKDAFGVYGSLPASLGARSGGSSPMTGQIDHAMLFDRALTAGEVARLYPDPDQIFAQPRLPYAEAGEEPSGTGRVIMIMSKLPIPLLVIGAFVVLAPRKPTNGNGFNKPLCDERHKRIDADMD